MIQTTSKIYQSFIRIFLIILMIKKHLYECLYCGNKDSIEHTFIDCPFTESFAKKLYNGLMKPNVVRSPRPLKPQEHICIFIMVVTKSVLSMEKITHQVK